MNKFGTSCHLRNAFILHENDVSINRKRHNECSAPLEIEQRTLAGTRVFWSAIGICVHNCQLCTRRLCQTLMGSHRMDEGQNFQKISAALPWKKTYGMTLLLARSISMDSTFKLMKCISFYCTVCPYQRFQIRYWDNRREELGGGLCDASERLRPNPHQPQAWIMGPKGRMQF